MRGKFWPASRLMRCCVGCGNENASAHMARKAIDVGPLTGWITSESSGVARTRSAASAFAAAISVGQWLPIVTQAVFASTKKRAARKQSAIPNILTRIFRPVEAAIDKTYHRTRSGTACSRPSRTRCERTITRMHVNRIGLFLSCANDQTAGVDQGKSRASRLVFGSDAVT